MTFSAEIMVLVSNLGIGFGDLLLLVGLMVSIIFMAKDLRIGLISYLLISLMIFIGLDAIGDHVAAGRAIIAIMLTGVVLALSIFLSQEKNQGLG